VTDATTPSTDGAPEEFEPAALERLIWFGGRKLLDSMVEMFFTHGPQRLTTGREAVERGDAAAAKLAFHSLKSSAAQLGAAELGRLSAEAEELARAERLDALAPLLPRLDAAYERAVKWMSDHRAQAETTG
jgi:HPt (histidine-containing phosphotransfer) domain-containing protein